MKHNIQDTPTLTVYDTESEMREGCITGRRWSAIIGALIATGQLVPRKGEIITGIALDAEYGLYFRYGEKKS